MIVYLLRNRINGMGYVGKTRQPLKARWRQHKTEARIGRLTGLLYREMRKYGAEVFEVTVLGERKCERDLNRLERQMIRHHNTVDHGYNQAVAAFGGRRRPKQAYHRMHSEQHKQKIAASVCASWIARRAASSG